MPDEPAVFGSRIFYFENPFVVKLQLETFLERFVLVPSSSDRVGEGDFMLLIVEVECLVGHRRTTYKQIWLL